MDRGFSLFKDTIRVRINGAFSEKMPVLSGIPQGSVLGPLLFIIYINDLPSVCEELCKIFLFADDSKLYKHITTEEDYLNLKQSCQNVFNWSEQWLMRLNTAKCKILTITKNSNYIHLYDYMVLLHVKMFLFLWIMLII